MRVIFSVVSLLVVVLIVGWLAKSQLQASRSTSGVAASAPALGGTPAQQSQQLQRQVRDDVTKALGQGMSRSETESGK